MGNGNFLSWNGMVNKEIVFKAISVTKIFKKSNILEVFRGNLENNSKSDIFQEHLTLVLDMSN